MAQMAAFLPMIMAGAQAAVGMMSGAGQARDQARAEGANATALEQQAGVTARETSLAEGLMFERRTFHALFATHDQKEGMAAFVEKRKPDFKNN